ncbi:MAG: P-loop NTPase fold protein, partial [Gammaproteobacteria bacterium]
MRLTTPRLEIEEGNAFEQDALDRKKFGVSLMNLVSRSDDALVIALNAPWGEGKTTFIKMWQGLLKENNVNSIYFDAFENDYVDDAFIAIASQIVSFIEMELSSTSSAKKNLKDLKKNAAKVGAQLLTWTVKLGIKAATLGVINASDIEALNDIKSDLAKDTSEVLSKYVQERIQSHKKNVQSIKSFKDTLSATADIIRQETGKPLIIIIDELDRCKPTYAVEIIEKIKHLFSVPNVVFILVMHKPQLEEAVKSVYGQGVNANIYLQKFINIECSLPKNIDPRNINDYRRYCNRLYQLHKLETWNDKPGLLNSVTALARHFDLSLRELEKCFTY